MAYNHKNRHFPTLRDFEPREIAFLLKLAADLKVAKYTGTEVPRLQGKDIALIFEKDSTRTHIGIEVAADDQGARVTYLGPTGSHIVHKKSVKDTARVLGRIYDAIEYRSFGQDIVAQLAQYSGVTVYNGLTDEFHPTQIMGQAQATAKQTGARFVITEDVDAAVKGVDFVYTDVWVSMGEPREKWAERIKLLAPHQVNADVMAKTGNSRTCFMHCLPEFHNAETTVGAEIKAEYGLDAMEVTKDVSESATSIVFDQADILMHTIKAALVATLGS
jgi:ornithine carbamoyltransferase